MTDINIVFTVDHSVLDQCSVLVIVDKVVAYSSNIRSPKQPKCEESRVSVVPNLSSMRENIERRTYVCICLVSRVCTATMLGFLLCQCKTRPSY